MTFYELYKNNLISLDNIDDFIDEWHNGNSDLTIYEFLGLTKKQYYHWVETCEL